MAEIRIRNLLAFEELEYYNDTGKWRYKHPLVKNKSERSQLEELFRTNPQEFLRQYTNCSNNISRYSSYIKNPKRKDKKQTDKHHLRRHQEREALFKSVLENKK